MKLISSTLALTSAVLLNTLVSAQQKPWPINIKTWRNFVLHGDYYSFNGDFFNEPK